MPWNQRADRTVRRNGMKKKRASKGRPYGGKRNFKYVGEGFHALPGKSESGSDREDTETRSYDRE